MSLFEEVSIREELPGSPGWYNITGDDNPRSCGRVWFDGTHFDFARASVSSAHLFNNNTYLYWLRPLRWQPMRTAPANGERILIKDEIANVFVAWFHGTNQGRDLWCYHLGDYACFVHQPKGWMPVPQ